VITKSDLYRVIEDHEFRGNAYFEGEWSLPFALWIETTPYQWKFACYPGDQYIVRKLENGDYLIVGGRVGEWWGIPHTSSEVEYRLSRWQLKHLKPRL
jgi:hypothetical protein